MLSDQFIAQAKATLSALDERLRDEAQFATTFIAQATRPANEKRWFEAVQSACLYGIFLTQNLLEQLDRYREEPEEQIGHYIGKMSIRSFLEIINACETATIELIEESAWLSGVLLERIDRRKALLDEHWPTEEHETAHNLKAEVCSLYERKIDNIRFVRDTLHRHGIIDDLDVEFLDFVWDIRNSIQKDFRAIKDMEFSAPGTDLNFSFHFKKGEELYHPEDLLSFYAMTRQIIFIQTKILQQVNAQDRGGVE